MRIAIACTLSAALALAALGCGGGSGSGAPESAAAPPQTSTTTDTPAPAAGEAKVTFRVQFPGQGQAVKSLMDPRTNRIVVSYNPWFAGGTYGAVTLTPENPTATLGLVPGEYEFQAQARQVEAGASEQDLGELLDTAQSTGMLVVGKNTVLLSFLSGNWTFVDAQGAAAPLELSSGAGSLVLDGFELRSHDPFGEMYRQASTASPHLEGGGNILYWGSRSPATPTVPFSDLSRISTLDHEASFNGTTNHSSLDGGEYNLTKRCGEYDPFAPPYYQEAGGGRACPEEAGDRFLLIIGGAEDPGSDNTPLLPDSGMTQNGQPFDTASWETSTVAAGDRITGHLAEVLVQSSTIEIVRPAARASKAAAVALTTRAKALEAALAGAGKAAQSSNSQVLGLTDTWAEHAIVCSGEDHGDWNLEQPIDVNGDGTPDAWEWGYVQSVYNPATQRYEYGSKGTCTNGITLPAGGAPGEWRDDNSNGLIETYEISDRDGNGTVDLGDLQLTHYLRYTEVMDVWVYPFAAKGTPGTKGVFTIDNAYLQYRTYENFTQNRFQAFAGVKLSGAPIQESDILASRIVGPTGELTIPEGNSRFYKSKYLSAVWNAATSSFGPATADFQTGFTINLSNYTDLPAGDYTVSLDTLAGTTVSTTVSFPGKVELRVVPAASMSALWADGNLTLSWVPPLGLVLDHYRVVLSSASDYSTGQQADFFYGRVAPGISSVTISAAEVAQVEALLPYIQSPQWVMQTRSYTGTNNHARGISDPVPLPDPNPAAR